MLDYLDNDKVIAEYLNATLEDVNPEVTLRAISDIATARAKSRLDKEDGRGKCVEGASDEMS